MKKPIKIILITGCILTAVWFIGQATHLFEFYTISTTSNLPAIKPGDIIFASRLKKPDTGSFIVFNRERDNSTWIFRCIAKEGDVVQIKKTAVYINGELLVEYYANNEHFIPKKELDRVKPLVAKNKDEVKKMTDKISVITLTMPQLKEYKLLDLEICSLPKDHINPNVFADFKNLGYNEDNLGPVTVPKGCFFVLGDNRHAAYDSRFLGFIKAEDVMSTVIK